MSVGWHLPPDIPNVWKCFPAYMMRKCWYAWCCVCCECCCNLGVSVDHSSGFGGQYGVEQDRQDASAIGWDDQEELAQHSSQSGTTTADQTYTHAPRYATLPYKRAWISLRYLVRGWLQLLHCIQWQSELYHISFSKCLILKCLLNCFIKDITIVPPLFQCRWHNSAPLFQHGCHNSAPLFQ